MMIHPETVLLDSHMRDVENDHINGIFVSLLDHFNDGTYSSGESYALSFT